MHYPIGKKMEIRMVKESRWNIFVDVKIKWCSNICDAFTWTVCSIDAW